MIHADRATRHAREMPGLCEDRLSGRAELEKGLMPIEGRRPANSGGSNLCPPLAMHITHGKGRDHA
jgi:hypothetical protein